MKIKTTLTTLAVLGAITLGGCERKDPSSVSQLPQNNPSKQQEIIETNDEYTKRISQAFPNNVYKGEELIDLYGLFHPNNPMNGEVVALEKFDKLSEDRKQSYYNNFNWVNPKNLTKRDKIYIGGVASAEDFFPETIGKEINRLPKKGLSPKKKFSTLWKFLQQKNFSQKQ